MKERPILFSAPMVRALLAGTKTVTRRIVKPQPDTETNRVEWNAAERAFVPWRLGSSTPSSGHRTGKPFACPYGVAGDRLWVRETHCRFSVGEGMDRPVPECVAYRATCADDGAFDYVNTRGEVMGLKVTKWTPAIHMPRKHSRITLEVVSIRVERLHEITEEDAKREGVEPLLGECRLGFEEIWKDINGLESWRANPFVWRVEFRRLADEAEQSGKAVAK